MNENVDGEQLLSIQTTMAAVKLLIINEYSFLSITNINSLDHRLSMVFPRWAHDIFGGMNIVLCSDPAQLPTVWAQPAYAYHGSTVHLAAQFHLFTKVVELDHLFHRTGDDPIQVHFHKLLKHIADCEATIEDQKWL